MTQSVMNGLGKGLHLLAESFNHCFEYFIIQPFSLAISNLRVARLALEPESCCLD
jgi:hypothetical protein